MLRSNSTESCNPSSMPNSFVLPKSISAISTWIITIGGRASSCSMIPLTSSKNRGVALRIRLLLTDFRHHDHFALDLLEGAGHAGNSARPGARC